MRSIHSFENIYIHRKPVDLRKSIGGLSVIASEDMGLDVKENSLFIFTNKRRTHLKVLYFDRSGFALWLKKLEENKFPWAKHIEKEVIEISSSDLELMLEGVNFWTRFEKLDFEYVV